MNIHDCEGNYQIVYRQYKDWDNRIQWGWFIECAICYNILSHISKNMLRGAIVDRTNRIYSLACELKNTRDALDAANKMLKSRGLLGVSPDISGPCFKDSSQFYGDVKQILKEFRLNKKNIKSELKNRSLQSETFKPADRVLIKAMNALLEGKFAQQVVEDNIKVLKGIPKKDWAEFIVKKTAERTLEIFLD